MSKEIKADDVIFNFFKQICDEKDDVKCVELGNSWINAMKTNLTNMEKNLDEVDKAKHQENIDSTWPLSVWVVKGKPYSKVLLTKTISKIKKYFKG